MAPDEQISEIYDTLLALQAEISALKTLMFQTNPALAAEHQRLADRYRQDFLRSRPQAQDERERQESS
jgi:hypothetical protein